MSSTESSAQKAIRDNLGILNRVLNNEAVFGEVAQKCVERRLITTLELAQLNDRLSGQTLRERVEAFVLRLAELLGDLPEKIDEFLSIIKEIDTLIAEKAANNISQSYANYKQAAKTNDADNGQSTRTKVAPSTPGIATKSSGHQDHESEEPVTSDWPWSKKKKPDEDIVYHYTTNPGRNRGIVLIINNVKFLDKSKDRDSSEEDEEKLKEAFDKYRYEVITMKNLEADAIKDAVKKVVQKDVIGDHDSFICCILSHGNPAGIEGVDLDGKTVTVTELANIVNCDKLHRKPKIFVFQACRGAGIPEPMVSDLAIPPSIREEEEVMVPDGHSIALPPEADFLFAFSTVENNRALRGKYTGSHYITALSNAIINHGSKLSIERILLVVNHKVAGESKRVEIEKDGKTETCIYHQMPEIRSTLRGCFYF
ncbi:PREDICTED: caspase-3-like [Amphimedon queenslandica]|uniref:Caspase family p20 domain-containing protein n=1 Tax=Amphimedon queenslandica TaxID=400682 RepID=A0A1X7UBX0_AMPQE|nr:PREDICTED: caspase-3-like [Amphimedon queenslandica]|eukprot:XP_019855217.1 PREDICTED: caspase-3-like [Amphimedon queenslandica]